MGPVIVPALQDAVKGGMYPPEVSSRLSGLIKQLGPVKPDALPEPMIEMRGARPDRPGINRGLSPE